ncbi:MAG: zeta toxin family protein, partial [Rhodocyclaceae bacterium]|nr:zeta toxin family protein [Rhodocyclaceae bacterium]
ELAARGGAVQIIGDDLRDYHPAYMRLMRADDKTAAFYTDRDTGRWVEKAIAEAKVRRANIVIEGTMRDGDKVAATMNSLREAGYQIEARALAVPWRLSEQGIMQRYENQKADRGTGRMTTEQAHRAAYEGMLQTLERIEREKLADRVTIYRRGAEAIYSNEVQDGQWVRNPQARAVVEAERARPMTLQERQEYAKGFDDLAELLARPERQATPEEIRRVDELRRAAKAALLLPQLKPIQRRTFEQADRQAVQDAVIEAVERDPEQFLRAYVADERSYGGRYISADLFKEQFAQFAQSKESRNRYNTPVHNAAAVLAAEQFRRALSDDSEPQRDKVIFLTGIPGAGKTSSVLAGGALPDDWRLVFEGQLSRPALAIGKIQQALDAGLRPVIIVVHARPENALEHTLVRFDEYGRGASINVMADIQGNLPDSLSQIRETFGDQVELIVHDYRDRRNHRSLTGWKHIDVLRSEGDQHEIRERLGAALQQRKPNLSNAAWRQAAGEPPPPLDYGLAERRNDQPQQDEPRPGIPQGNRQASVLTAAATDENTVEAALANYIEEAMHKGERIEDRVENLINIVADAEAVQSEQRAMLDGASIEQTYEATLADYAEAMDNQVARLEGRLENLIKQQEARVKQMQNDAPGKFSLPGTKRAWQANTAREQAK